MEVNRSAQGEETFFPEREIKFASFWSRFWAYFLDGLIIAAFFLPVTYFNVIQWKLPVIFMISASMTIAYKPFMEYRFSATFGKMALGIKVVGLNFERVTLKEVLSRVSFYIVPSILQQLYTLRIYFLPEFNSINSFIDYSKYASQSNAPIGWLEVLVFILFILDCITFFRNEQNRFLHDIYAGTYVIETDKNQ